MVNVGSKDSTKRTAHARCLVQLPQHIMDQLQHTTDNLAFHTKKGPIFTTAIIAGTMGAKQTSTLIPFCHPLNIEKCNITVTPTNATQLTIDCLVSCTGKTGVEMEALTGCSIAALTIYDMCKALSHDIVISQLQLIKKTGGKSDFQKGETNNNT